MKQIKKVPTPNGAEFREYEDAKKQGDIVYGTGLNSPAIKHRLNNVATSSKTSGLLSLDEPTYFG